MAFTAMIERARLSDLIVTDYDPSTGYTHDDINVTPPAASAPLTLGTVVFRAKSIDPEAPYAVLSASTDVVATNEFAVVFGDHYAFNPSFVPKAIAAGKFNAIAVRRGPITLKEYHLKKITQDVGGAALTNAQFASLKELLKLQGIVVLDTVEAV